MKENMRPGTRARRLAAAALIAAGTLSLASCATVNRLAEFDVQGRTLAVEMRTAPEPRMEVQYRITFDFSNPIGTAINWGSNIAKAANAEHVDSLMRQALEVVDVPGMVRDESYETSLTVLGAEREDDPGSAEYLMDFDIHTWGVRASSWTSAVSLRMELTASLRSNAEKTVVWRRDIDVERQATPAMFGLDSTLSNFVSADALASLSEEDLQNGFDALARDTALAISRALQDDLDDARDGD